MTENIIYTLKWKYFNYIVKTRVSDVIKEQRFCDVTLVSDDHKPFLAHRYILCSFSPVLKNILFNNPHPHPLIYLRGVNHQELESILQFIYFGKASVDHSNMKRFAQAAKDLQIRKLAENIRMGCPPEDRDDLVGNDDNTNKDINQDNEELIENKDSERSVFDTADEIFNPDIPVSDELGSGRQVYKCEECEASYKSKRGLDHHTSSKHEGICYSCKNCGYKATQQGNLKQHQESMHEDVKYPCNQCDYQATQSGQLKEHIQVVHECIKYSCDKCNYQATQQSNLKTHKKAVHDGVKYSCDKCNYQSGWKQKLKEHKDSKHPQPPSS